MWLRALQQWLRDLPIWLQNSQPWLRRCPIMLRGLQPWLRGSQRESEREQVKHG